MVRSRSRFLLAAVAATPLLSSCGGVEAPQVGTAPLPPFPAGDPKAWVCQGSPPPPGPEAIRDWCETHPDRGRPASLGVSPATVSDLASKNRYDETLRAFLRDRGYRKLAWIADRSWRLTGPYVGPFGDGKSYGVHPAVRVWYSPEMVDWLCAGRPEGAIPDGAMLIKEMAPIDPKALDIDPAAACMVIDKDPDAIEPGSWTVMVRAGSMSHDGWYWANPTGSGDGNPPILTESAVTTPGFFGPDPDHPQDNPRWYPTGDLFQDPATPGSKLADVVTPYSEFGAYCLNCHASAERLQTFASLDNVLAEGLLYRHFGAAAPKDLFDDFSGGEHGAGDNDETERAALAQARQQAWAFTPALPTPAPGFTEFYGALGPTEFGDAFRYRLPAETFDHHLAAPEKTGAFLTSDQCIGCHDATVSNDSTPNMLITDPGSGNAVNVSPYAEWRASPMGLAGRDPIFYSQLQSETNHLPQLAECIENTCLHCHGVMGERQLAIDTETPDPQCKDLFAIAPPPEVPFGKPMRLNDVTEHQGPGAKYGNLARDGISCTVCHHVAETALGSEASFTGNWVAGPADEVFGPYEKVIEKPMKHALGVTPKHGKQVQGSDLCGTCHNILLPVFNNDGTRHTIAAPNGQRVTSTYEQTTHLEWRNSDFARGSSFQSCQDCHMPAHYKTPGDLAGTRIANIESSAFAPTTDRLPDKEITLTARDHYARHSLHGLNLFVNEMFQQFPVLLGIRQIDYMGATTTQPALITAALSMDRMAKHETAAIAISGLEVDRLSGAVEARLEITNKTGHYLPSGVGFRRIFIELTATDRDGKLLWASGRTNALGVILDGTSARPLATEYGTAQSGFQPHYQRITRGDQVQIYQELIRDSAGRLTTAFLRRVKPVKDNRLRPKGFDPRVFLRDPSPFIQILGEIDGDERKDPHYSDPKLTGSDQITYAFALTPREAGRIARVEARLYSQSIPPFYLQQRFEDAAVGPAQQDQIRRLYYMTSHLNAGAGTRIAGWKVEVARAEAGPGG
jgi:hypothetical protein